MVNMESGVMDYEFEMEKPFIVTTADMLEIAASGGNGSEYVDIVGLMENAAKELREKDAEIELLRDALTWIERHPVEESKQWEVAVKEMKRLARSALPQKEKD